MAAWDKAGKRNGVNASFVYDADGQRIKGTVNGVTTAYVAGVYEYQAGATTYYYEGNALRRTGYASDNGVYYLVQDHLKSTSTIVNQNGTLTTHQYYLPHGGYRAGTVSSLTTKRFTGQYHEASLSGGDGLSYYNARWYDAKLGRFLSADAIVPEPSNPQVFNRYSYIFNHPPGFVDPSGQLPLPQRSFSAGGGKSGSIPACNRNSGCNVSTPLVRDCSRNACRSPQVSMAIRFYTTLYSIPEA
jgi:RHS repeat-associated protein